MKQSRQLVLGLTGGIASGKSQASNTIKQLGYMVIDADELAREVIEIGKPAYKKIVNCFGNEILDETGNIDRKALGSIIFDDDNKREELNRITHPYIFRAMEELIKNNLSERIIFLDIPLLIEELDRLKEHNIRIDEIWLVYVDEKTQLIRLMKRDSISREEAIKRIKAQMPLELKKDYANRVIDNRGDIKALEKQIRENIEEVI